MKRLLLLGLFSAGLAATGCYADAGYYGPTTAVAVAGPNMVYVDGAPGVQVVADYDYPVFYSDGLYWRYDGGIWYSSRWHDRGWGRSYNVPVGVRGIREPGMYAHYHGNVGYRTNAGVVRGNYGATYRANPNTVVRDHRSEPVRSAPVYRSAPSRGPVVRDHRSR